MSTAPRVVAVLHDGADPAASTPAWRLLGWMAEGAGPAPTAVVWHGDLSPRRPQNVPVIDAEGAGRWPPVVVARLAGARRVSMGLRGRRVRRLLGDLEGAETVYLNTGFSVPALRYLPPGERNIVTHLRAVDCLADPVLPETDAENLRRVTNRWLADSANVAAWAADRFELPRGDVEVHEPPVDPTPPVEAAAARRAAGLAAHAPTVAVIAANWWLELPDAFLPVLVALGRMVGGPLQVVWGRPVGATHALFPLRHDLAQAGVDATLHQPPPGVSPFDLADVVLCTLGDDPWSSWLHEAASRARPVACFATHHEAEFVEGTGGPVVPYTEPSALAGATAELLVDGERREALGARAREAALAVRGVDALGPRFLTALGVPGRVAAGG